MNDIHNNVKVGDHLFSTCGQNIAGTIVAINIDMMRADIIMYCGSDCFGTMDDEDESEVQRKFLNTPLLARDIKIDQFLDVDYDWYEIGIQFNTPWSGCNRCVSSFWIQSNTGNDFAYSNMKCWNVGDPLPEDYSKYAVLM